jgi:hypothetical protein
MRPRKAVLADVAQLVEHSLGKGEVTSSILVIGSRDWQSGRRFWEGHGFQPCRMSRNRERL